MKLKINLPLKKNIITTKFNHKMIDDTDGSPYTPKTIVGLHLARSNTAYVKIVKSTCKTWVLSGHSNFLPQNRLTG